MKYIFYKSRGYMQVLDERGELVEKEVDGMGRLPYSEENLEYAKAIAANGEYTIEDDGVEEVTVQTQDERIAELEEALELLLSGVTE